MRLLLTLTLLLFELSISLGHYLPRIEKNAYEIEEGGSYPVRIVNPKPEKPTLREVVYYHLIERPYKSKETKSSEIEDKEADPDVAETSRPFTNGHGYQFLQFLDIGTSANDTEVSSEDITEETDIETEETDETVETEETDIETEETGETVETEETDNETEETETETEETDIVYYDESTEEVNSQEPSTTAFTTAIDENPEGYGTDSTEPKNISTTIEAVTEDTTTDVEKEITEPEITTTKEDDVVKEKKTARNLLFNELRERYQQQRKPSGKSSRRKREVELEDIPEAPRLPPLNYNSLPEYVRKMISTEASVTAKDSDEEIERFSEYYDEKDIEHIIEQKLTDIFSEFEHSVENEDSEIATKKPRTYGINLTNNGGYVWNDLWTESGTSFEVGDLQITDEIEENKDDINKNPNESDATQNESKPQQNQNDLDDIFVDKSEIKSPAKSPVEKRPQITNEQKRESTTEINQAPEETIKDIQRSKDLGYISEIKPEIDNGKMHGKKIDMLVEIMKDERFWKWLAEWTSTYMELLTKYIRKIVRDEIANQLKSHLERLTSGQIKHYDLTDIPIEPNKDAVEEIVPEPIIEDNKLNIDGKEIPITHSSNFDDKDNASDKETDMLRRGKKDNEKKFPGFPGFTKPIDKDSEKKPPAIVEAQNIYGNSVNSENVTNIFIFLGNNVASNLFKSTTNDSHGIYIFGKENINTDKKETQPSNADSETTTQINEENKTNASPSLTENLPDYSKPGQNEVDPITTTEINQDSEVEKYATQKEPLIDENSIGTEIIKVTSDEHVSEKTQLEQDKSRENKTESATEVSEAHKKEDHQTDEEKDVAIRTTEVPERHDEENTHQDLNKSEDKIEPKTVTRR